MLHIPCLPDLDLSANKRRNRRNRVWQAQARDTATERERAFVELREAGRQAARERGFTSDLDILGPGRLKFPVELHWTLYFPGRAWDYDACAAALKAWGDAMTRPVLVMPSPRLPRGRSAPGLAWLPNDGPKYVACGSFRPVPRSPEGPSMTLEIRPV